MWASALIKNPALALGFSSQVNIFIRQVIASSVSAPAIVPPLIKRISRASAFIKAPATLGFSALVIFLQKRQHHSLSVTPPRNHHLSREETGCSKLRNIKKQHDINPKKGETEGSLMKKNVASWTHQGNICFLAGNYTQANAHYYNALRESGALQSVVRYVQKNQDNLQENQKKLHELLTQKYHITLYPGALSILLMSIQKQLKLIENEQACKQLKKKILLHHPKNPRTVRRRPPRTLGEPLRAGDRVRITITPRTRI